MVACAPAAWLRRLLHAAALHSCPTQLTTHSLAAPQDTPYPDSLHMYDVSTDFPLVHVEGRVHHSAAGKQGHLGGLALVSRITCTATDLPDRPAMF